MRHSQRKRKKLQYTTSEERALRYGIIERLYHGYPLLKERADKVVLRGFLSEQPRYEVLRLVRNDVKALVLEVPFGGRHIGQRLVVIIAHEGREAAEAKM